MTRCHALLTNGSLGFGGKRDSKAGDRCKNKAKEDGLCGLHLKFKRNGTARFKEIKSEEAATNPKGE